MHLRATFARLLLVATLVGTSATLASGAWTGAGSAPAPRQTMQSHGQSKPHFFAGYRGYGLFDAFGDVHSYGDAQNFPYNG